MLKKYLLLAVMLLAACSSAPEKSSESILDNGAGGARCMLMDAAPEEIDDRVNVYLAMARAAKYNSRVVADNMKQKIFADNPNLTPKDIIENVLNNPDGGSELYNGLRVLDYAILYAGAYLADSQQSADDLILQRAAQSLAVAAVKAQGNVWLANRKIREINGMIKDENKNLAEINLLYEKNGTLDEATQEYRTALDVILRKLKDNREILIGETLEYRKLIKDKREKIELDGRKFYELDTFDKSLELSIFEKAALAGRDELKAKKVNIKGLSYEAINRYLAYRYDEVERLKINGYKENSTPYAEAVEKYAARAANSLIDAIVAFRANKKPEDSFALQEKMVDELASAILIQVQVAYAAVNASAMDYDVADTNIRLLKKEIGLLKGRSLKAQQKEELLEKQSRLLDLEILKNRILAERAAAIVSLYFYAGFSPFECQLLNQKPEQIAKVLRQGLNADRVKMLAAAFKEPVAPENRLPEIKKWAIGDNWLENTLEGKNIEKKPVPVVENKPVNKPKKTPQSLIPQVEQPEDDFAPYTDPEVNKRKMMQLGSYIEPKNADLDWNILSNLYPELKKYKPQVEKTEVNGVVYHRLVIRSQNGGFMALCNKLRSNRVQCLLR